MNSVYNNNTHSSPHRRNSDNDPRSGTRAGRTVTGNATYSYDRQMDTCATVMTTVPEGIMAIFIFIFFVNNIYPYFLQMTK